MDLRVTTPRLAWLLHQKLKFNHTDTTNAPPINNTAKLVVLACLTKNGACSHPLFARIFDPLAVLRCPSETGGGSGPALWSSKAGGELGALLATHGESGLDRTGMVCWWYCWERRRSG